MKIELNNNYVILESEAGKPRSIPSGEGVLERVNNLISYKSNRVDITFVFSSVSLITDNTTSPPTVYQNETLPSTAEDLYNLIVPFFFRVTSGNAQNIKSNYNVDAATTGSLPTATYDNAAGTLTGVVNQALSSIDSISPALNLRILVKDQANPIQNGIYTISQIGDINTPYILTRFEGYNQPEELDQSLVTVLGGSTQKDFQFFQTTPAPTLGVDNILYSLQTTLAVTVAKYTTTKTIYVDKDSNFATDTRQAGDKYNRDKPFSTIQAALNAASNGDLVKVLFGTYSENITTPAVNLILNFSGGTHTGTLDIGLNNNISQTIENGNFNLIRIAGVVSTHSSRNLFLNNLYFLGLILLDTNRRFTLCRLDNCRGQYIKLDNSFSENIELLNSRIITTSTNPALSYGKSLIIENSILQSASFALIRQNINNGNPARIIKSQIISTGATAIDINRFGTSISMFLYDCYIKSSTQCFNIFSDSNGIFYLYLQKCILHTGTKLINNKGNKTLSNLIQSQFIDVVGNKPIDDGSETTKLTPLLYTEVSNLPSVI